MDGATIRTNRTVYAYIEEGGRRKLSLILHKQTSKGMTPMRGIGKSYHSHFNQRRAARMRF